MSYATIKFWGVRGSLARPGLKTALFGGNTPCLEIRYGKRLIICDAGTGIYNLGQNLKRRRTPFGGTLLLSHYHWDHIIGLPFFAPVYDKKSRFTIIGRAGLKKAIFKLLSPPNFPVKFSDFRANIRLTPKGEQKFRIGGILVESFEVNHPNGAFGYSFKFPNGKKLVFISDNGPQANDSKLIGKIYKADLLIHDAQYLPKEFLRRKRFGHSPYQYVLDIAGIADIKSVALFHHDPSRTDTKLRQIEKSAQKLGRTISLKSRVFAAREGMVIKL